MRQGTPQSSASGKVSGKVLGQEHRAVRTHICLAAGKEQHRALQAASVYWPHIDWTHIAVTSDLLITGQNEQHHMNTVLYE